jgi:hypothetical protein
MPRKSLIRQQPFESFHFFEFESLLFERSDTAVIEADAAKTIQDTDIRDHSVDVAAATTIQDEVATKMISLAFPKYLQRCFNN